MLPASNRNHTTQLQAATTLQHTSHSQVVASDIDEKNGEKLAAELKREFGEGNVIFVKADVTNSESLEEVFKAAKSTFGRLDIVVNNAGILREDLWQKAIDINVKGTVHGVLLSHKYLGKASGWW